MIVQEDYLAHVGVLGMHWRHHKSQSTIQSNSANTEKWGTDKEHNILYITGYSGSGKSTLAKSFKTANPNTNIIHLDPYFEKMDKNVASNLQDKEFNNFLNKNFPDYKLIAGGNMQDRHNKEHWARVDNLMAQTEKFAAQQFPKKKVIVEGVQLSDNTTYPNKDFFKDKLLLIARTGALTSFLRSNKRDGIVIKGVQDAKEYIQWYGSMNKSISKLSKTANVKKGNAWVEKYLATTNTKEK